ncbi:hypothetical protein RP726_17205 [Candidatus Methylospira mobilis]|uniref:hypothetical protein n=1 Tax=Candidatus Methylospira mobilis TaxID=1808979 RepID=UPI0028F00A24|nr:hypothetical protein [Candidatus Methylospira mobilis]WNV04129.1 hypothetical protein RP726_17205 [Candidatus Methylospira mobilis]
MLINVWRVVRLLPNYRDRAISVSVISALLGLLGTATIFLYKYLVDIVSSLLHGEACQNDALRTLGNYLATVVSRLFDDEIYQNDAVRALFICLIVLALMRAFIIVLGVVQGRISQDLFVDSILKPLRRARTVNE